jgi:hypothetical protein
MAVGTVSIGSGFYIDPCQGFFFQGPLAVSFVYTAMNMVGFGSVVSAFSASWLSTAPGTLT